MCSTALESVSSGESLAHSPVITLCEVSAAKVSGWMNFCAEAVMTTSTVHPRSCNLRASSADLYAAMPPPTPSTTRIARCLARDYGHVAVAHRILVLHESATYFFHGGNGGFFRGAGKERACAILQL